MSKIRTINPATGETLRDYEEHDSNEVERRLAAAAVAFEAWRGSPLEERARLLRSAVDVLESRRDRYARLMTEEMGKTIGASAAEVDKCVWGLKHYAEHGASYLRARTIETDASRSYVRFDPIGPVLAIMPWNFPFWQVFRFAAPALMAGNVGLLKHASNVTGCSLAIEEVLRDAGFPSGCFQSLVIPSSRVAGVIEDPRVEAVTLTGSDPAGRAVAATAGGQIKKTVLELGGSDPFVVLEDADIDRAARVAVTARMVNTGQSCIAAKRFIVHRDVREEFVRKLTERVRALVVGDPMEPSTEIGPMAREDLVAELHDQVRRSVAMGARVVAGGERDDGDGCFYPPTVLDRVTPEQPVAREETFGPVAAVIEVASEDEAIALANDTTFGLGASLWTRDTERAERLVARMDAGNVFVNGMVKSDPRLPFGGVKRSGYGRELGLYGIREFVNVKTVWVA